MALPNSETQTIRNLSHAFDNTTATYKFFWFISILQIYAGSQADQIYIRDIMAHMVANAWYPVHYFKLSFGSLDKLFDTVIFMHQYLGIPVEANPREVVEALQRHYHEKEVEDRLMAHAKYVPYRFLNPWLHTPDDKPTIELSQRFYQDCPYALFKDEHREMYIRINPTWRDYLLTHYRILLDFARWNLTLFLQSRNPNVPAISDKLTRVEHRHSLSHQRAYWNRVIEIRGSLQCIYTGREIHLRQYDLDHFIPWSFVAHDLLWNLIPVDPSINSSKSDRLPDLKRYLPKLARMQQESLRAVWRQGSQLAVLDDYLSLGYSLDELVGMRTTQFTKLLQRTITPIHQIASNMGFEVWDY
jgi:hypothetical protein